MKNRNKIKENLFLFMQSFTIIYIFIIAIQQLVSLPNRLYFVSFILLVLIIILGIVSMSVINKRELKKKKKRNKLFIYSYVSILSIITSIITYINGKSFGFLDAVITLVFGIMIFTIGFMLIKEKE